MRNCGVSTTLVNFLYHWDREEKELALNVLDSFLGSSNMPSDINCLFDLSFSIDYLARFHLIKPSFVNILDEVDDFIYKKIISTTNDELNEIQFFIRMLNHSHNKALFHADYDLKYKYRAINYFEILRSLVLKLKQIEHHLYRNNSDDFVLLPAYLILKLSFISISSPSMNDANKAFLNYVRFYISKILVEDISGNKIKHHIRFLIIYLSIKQYGSPVWQSKFQYYLSENLSKFSESNEEINFLLALLNNERYKLNHGVLNNISFSNLFVNVLSSYMEGISHIINP
ncbi:hypothetical protein [Sphingobacterium thalpophilum]|uniref:hypothetical protein n=1 Tax=Sphingobacterium thalpophilum TaxID=259 RepID=UPI003C750515